MAHNGKKICFGFNKSTKKQNLGSISRSSRQKVELIDCLESHTIKIKDANEEIYTPLVIPMTKSNTTLLQRKRINVKSEESDQRPDSELTPDELAARELIREAQNSVSNGEPKKILTLPLVPDDTDLINDKEEPTLEDYESVPITDYGFAMLRGMGWKEGMGIGKTSGIAKVKEPNLRPKGMGLGANLVLNKKITETNREELVLKKGAYAKITDGKQKGQYCEVQGFDEEAGRIIVKTSFQGVVLALNEFLVTPVTKEEYAKSSKVINNAKFEEYKSREAQHSSGSSQSNKSDKHHDPYKANDNDSKEYTDSHNGSDYKGKNKKKDYNKKYSSSDSKAEYDRQPNKERSKQKH